MGWISNFVTRQCVKIGKGRFLIRTIFTFFLSPVTGTPADGLLEFIAVIFSLRLSHACRLFTCNVIDLRISLRSFDPLCTVVRLTRYHFDTRRPVVLFVVMNAALCCQYAYYYGRMFRPYMAFVRFV
jgi:hypothetical protein